MYRQPKTTGMVTLVGLIFVIAGSDVWASPLAVTNTFQPDTPATADSVNQNFLDVENAVNDNDARITTNTTNIDGHETRILALEGLTGVTLQSVPIDCNADSNALINATINDNTSYLLTGMCNGPIIIFRKRNVVLQGASNNKTLDGVQLPPGIVSNPFAAIGIYESIAELRDLTADASNYVAGTGNPWGSGISTVAVGQNASARIYNTDIKGGDWALDVFRNGYAKTYETVTITGFNEFGIKAFYNSHVEVLNDITVTGRVGTTVSFPNAVTARFGSVLDIRGGGTITSPTGGASLSTYSIGAYNAGVVHVRSAITLNDGFEIGQVSHLRMEAGTISGNISCYESSHCRLRNVNQSGGEVWVARNGTLRVDGTSTIDTTGFLFRSTLGSNIGIRDSANITAPSIQVRSNATFYTQGCPDLNSSPINCDSQADQIVLVGTTINVAFGTCP